jgi:hypothetical protein
MKTVVIHIGDDGTYSIDLHNFEEKECEAVLKGFRRDDTEVALNRIKAITETVETSTAKTKMDLATQCSASPFVRFRYEPGQLLAAYRQTFQCTYKEVCAAARVNYADLKRWRRKHAKMYPASKGADRLLTVLRSGRSPDWWRRHSEKLPS